VGGTLYTLGRTEVVCSVQCSQLGDTVLTRCADNNRGNIARTSTISVREI